MTVHPTAIVDPKAKVGVNVEIGPYSIIGAEVEIGDNSYISSHVRITGNTKIGNSNQFFHACSIGEKAQDIQYHSEDGCVVIGDNNIFREHSTLHRPNKDDGLTQIGNGCYFMVYSHIAHDCVLGDFVIIANSSSLAGFVHVEERAFISAYVGVHQHCRIGKLAMIGGFSKITQDVPPFIMVAGHPALADTLNVRGMKRVGITSDSLSSLRKVFDLVYQENKYIKNVISEIKQVLLPQIKEKAESHRLVNEFINFISASKRGIINCNNKFKSKFES